MFTQMNFRSYYSSFTSEKVVFAVFILAVALWVCDITMFLLTNNSAILTPLLNRSSNYQSVVTTSKPVDLLVKPGLARYRDEKRHRQILRVGFERYKAKNLYPVKSLLNSTSLKVWQKFLEQDVMLMHNVLLLSIGVGSDIAGYGRINQQRIAEYAILNNYNFVYADHLLNSSYAPSWQKVLLILSILSKTGISQPDFIAYIDADAYITNLNVRIQNFFKLSTDRRIEFVISAADPDNPSVLFSAGILILRNTPLMHQFFISVLQKYDRYPRSQFAENFEQDVMLAEFYRNDQLQRQTLIVPLCLLQSYDAVWEPGDFIFHAPGMQKHRAEWFNFLADNPEKNWNQIKRYRKPGPWFCNRS